MRKKSKEEKREHVEKREREKKGKECVNGYATNRQSRQVSILHDILRQILTHYETLHLQSMVAS